MPSKVTRTALENTGLYARGVPLELRRFLEEEALRRKYAGAPATIGELVSEALRFWRDHLQAGGVAPHTKEGQER